MSVSSGSKKELSTQHHPMGIGFNRNAFFDTLDREFQLNGEIHCGYSHNGVVDFMIARGIPAVLESMEAEISRKPSTAIQ